MLVKTLDKWVTLLSHQFPTQVVAMPPKKQKGGGSLGRAVMKNRFGPEHSKRSGEGWLHTTDITEEYEGKGLQSVTETGDLDEFLTTAEMSGREFLGGMFLR